MNNTIPNREELEHQAMEAQSALTEQKEYVERPKSQRVLAWILAAVRVIGVILYFGWISGLIHF